MREVFEVVVHGSRPYLMHAFKSEEGTTKKRGKYPSVEEDCESALYRKPDGTIYVPNNQVWASMRGASSKFKWKGRQSFWALVNSSIFVEPDQIPIQPQTFKPFSSAVVINRARIMKSRPQFDDWTLNFKIVVTDESLTESVVKDILTEAGMTSGIGDWRPRFGTYTITSWKKSD